jgi:hypothetical protein
MDLCVEKEPPGMPARPWKRQHTERAEYKAPNALTEKLAAKVQLVAKAELVAQAELVQTALATQTGLPVQSFAGETMVRENPDATNVGILFLHQESGEREAVEVPKPNIGVRPSCNLCKRPRTFKNDRLLRVHHNKYHAGAGCAMLKDNHLVLPSSTELATQTLPTFHTNPVMQNPLMKLTIEDFKICRITANCRISVIDAIAHFRQCSKAYATRLWQLQYHDTSFLTSGILVDFHQFSSRGGPKTPVATFYMLLQILPLIPGPQGKILRAAQADLACRAIAGDHDLQAALSLRRVQMDPACQALVLKGIASSSDALLKRQLHANTEVQKTKLLAETGGQVHLT